LSEPFSGRRASREGRAARPFSAADIRDVKIMLSSFQPAAPPVARSRTHAHASGM